MKKKVSIIIPIYNVEKYLKKCVDSVLQQTYKNLEIILVDDGSPDKCGKICDTYEKEDNRIKVIHKINGGLSDARNKGIEYATGDYYFFLDSDDFLACDAIEYLVDLVETTNSDIGAFSIYYYNFLTHKKERAENVDKDYILEMNKEQALFQMINTKINFGWKACNKLYKSELFKNVRFPFGKLYEDVGTTYKLILNANKIVYSSIPKYYYVNNDQSITRTYLFNEKELARIEMAEQMCTEIDLKINNKKLSKKLNYFKCTQYLAVINIMIRSDCYNYYIIRKIKNIIRNNIFTLMKYADKKKMTQFICIFLSFNIYKYMFKRAINMRSE